MNGEWSLAGYPTHYIITHFHLISLKDLSKNARAKHRCNLAPRKELNDFLVYRILSREQWLILVPCIPHSIHLLPRFFFCFHFFPFFAPLIRSFFLLSPARGHRGISAINKVLAGRVTPFTSAKSTGDPTLAESVMFLAFFILQEMNPKAASTINILSPSARVQIYGLVPQNPLWRTSSYHCY